MACRFQICQRASDVLATVHVHRSAKAGANLEPCMLCLPGGPAGCPRRGSDRLRALSCEGLAHHPRKLTSKIRMRNVTLTAERTTVHFVLDTAERFGCWHVQCGLLQCCCVMSASNLWLQTIQSMTWPSSIRKAACAYASPSLAPDTAKGPKFRTLN